MLAALCSAAPLCVLGQLLVFGLGKERWRGIRRHITRDEAEQTPKKEEKVLIFYSLLTIVPCAFLFRFLVYNVHSVHSLLKLLLLPPFGALFMWSFGTVAILIFGTATPSQRTARGLLVGLALGIGFSSALFL
jgi:hypothetical protein